MDMAQKRHAAAVILINNLATTIVYNIMVSKVDEKESRIVDKDGKVLSVWETK